MKIVLLAVLTAITIFGCAANEKRAQEAQQKIKAIAASEPKAVVRYPNATLCSKAFSATKVYVMDKSDMRVQLSDDTLVATYGPTKYGNIGITASRKPDSGDACLISINTRCRGEDMADSPGIMTLCQVKIVEINDGFRPFVETAVGTKSN